MSMDLTCYDLETKFVTSLRPAHVLGQYILYVWILLCIYICWKLFFDHQQHYCIFLGIGCSGQALLIHVARDDIMCNFMQVAWIKVSKLIIKKSKIWKRISILKWFSFGGRHSWTLKLWSCHLGSILVTMSLYCPSIRNFHESIHVTSFLEYLWPMLNIWAW